MSQFKLVLPQVRSPRSILILFWAFQCQAFEFHRETKKSTSPGAQSVEIDVFSEDDICLSKQDPQKVIFPGCSRRNIQLIHTHSPRQPLWLSRLKYQDKCRAKCQNQILSKGQVFLTSPLSHLGHDNSILCWLFCLLQDIQQHPWHLSTRC